MGLFSAGSIDIEIEMQCKRVFSLLCCRLSGFVATFVRGGKKKKKREESIGLSF